MSKVRLYKASSFLQGYRGGAPFGSAAPGFVATKPMLATPQDSVLSSPFLVCPTVCSVTDVTGVTDTVVPLPYSSHPSHLSRFVWYQRKNYGSPTMAAADFIADSIIGIQAVCSAVQSLDHSNGGQIPLQQRCQFRSGSAPHQLFRCYQLSYLLQQWIWWCFLKFTVCPFQHPGQCFFVSKQTKPLVGLITAHTIQDSPAIGSFFLVHQKGSIGTPQ